MEERERFDGSFLAAGNVDRQSDPGGVCRTVIKGNGSARTRISCIACPDAAVVCPAATAEIAVEYVRHRYIRMGGWRIIKAVLVQL